MKTSRFQQLFMFLAILTVSIHCSVQAVTIAVSPSSVSNLYQGYITVTVSNGLANGEAVLVEKFVDYNTNGAVDTGDMLVHSLRLGDGQANVFGGVTNMNFPGDLTPTNGAIKTVISLYGTHPGKFIGNYVFRVSSPTGNFSPATTPFAVTNSNFGQAISGAVRNNGTNVPYGGVFVLGGPDQEFLGGVFADAAGNFTYRSAPGTYFLGAAKSGYVFDFSTAPQVTLSSGVNATADAPLTVATRMISGTVRELGNPSKTLGGVEINCEAQNGFVLAFTDPNGNFTIPVTADVWKLSMQEDLVGLTGYLAPDDEPVRPLVDTAAGSVSGVNIDLPKVNALFYGNLKTSANLPLVGIGVGAEGSSYPYSGRGNTDASGNYFIGVVATNWNVNPESDTLSALGYSASGTNTSINAGQAIQINFTAQTLTVHLGGRVVDGGGSPISNIRLSVSDWMGNNFGGSTDDNGYFNIGLVAGTWHLQLAGDDAADRGLVGPDLVFSNLVDGASITNILYVAQNVTASITGHVRDTNSSPITFVNVFANITVNGTNYLAGAETDASGNYSMGVFNGTWSVGVSGDDLYNRGFETPPNQSVVVSGANGTANFTVYGAQPLQITTTNLPGGVVFQNYHINLQAAGGQQPYSWSFVSGSLPPGITFDSGLLDGIPTNSGTFNFTVRAGDQQGNTTNRNLSITISPAGSNSAPYFVSYGKNGNGRFEMLIQGLAGRSYRFEGSTTLATNSWTALQTSSANPSDGKVYFQDTNSQSFNARFYRAVLLP